MTTLTRPALITIVLPINCVNALVAAVQLPFPPQPCGKPFGRWTTPRPGLTFSICEETGDLRPFVNVFVGQESVRFLQGIDTPVAPGDVVHIIHSVAGGATPTP